MLRKLRIGSSSTCWLFARAIFEEGRKLLSQTANRCSQSQNLHSCQKKVPLLTTPAFLLAFLSFFSHIYHFSHFSHVMWHFYQLSHSHAPHAFSCESPLAASRQCDGTLTWDEWLTSETWPLFICRDGWRKFLKNDVPFREWSYFISKGGAVLFRD